MFMGRFLLVVLLLTACSVGAPPRAATVTPSPNAATPKHGPAPSRSAFLAVVGGPKNSSVSLVASDGTVIATTAVDLAPFRMHVLMSWTSATRTRLYYLNAGSEVRYLAPDGTTGTVTRIGLGATEQAGFAVSPDDASIAVAVFSYTLVSGPPAAATYSGMRLYVEDLHGGGHHVDIFSSTTVAEFPIGWTSGKLVIAVSAQSCCQAQPINPYDATSYHVADPATGKRLASLCDNSLGPEGPVEPAGAICFESATEPRYQHWDGTLFQERGLGPGTVPNPGAGNALAPDGTRVAVGGTSPSIRLVPGPPGSVEELVSEAGYVFGWLDSDRIVFQAQGSNALSVLELDTKATADISPGGAYLGTLPTALT